MAHLACATRAPARTRLPGVTGVPTLCRPCASDACDAGAGAVVHMLGAAPAERAMAGRAGQSRQCQGARRGPSSAAGRSPGSRHRPWRPPRRTPAVRARAHAALLGTGPPQRRATARGCSALRQPPALPGPSARHGVERKSSLQQHSGPQAARPGGSPTVACQPAPPRHQTLGQEEEGARPPALRPACRAAGWGRACVPMMTTSCAAAVMPQAMGAVATSTCAAPAQALAGVRALLAAS